MKIFSFSNPDTKKSQTEATIDLYFGTQCNNLFTTFIPEKRDTITFDNISDFESEAVKQSSKIKSDTRVVFGSKIDPYQANNINFDYMAVLLDICIKKIAAVTVITSSDKILNHIELLKKLTKKHLSAEIIIPTVDDEICSKISPDFCPPQKRFDILEKLSTCGIKCGININPIIPFINDNHEETGIIITQAHRCGIKFAQFGRNLIFTHETEKLFYKNLETRFPEKIDLMRSTYFGQTNYTSRNYPLISNTFVRTCRKLGIVTHRPVYLPYQQTSLF